MLRQKTAPGGGPGAGRMRRGGVALPLTLYSTREQAKRQEAIFDKTLSYKLDAVLSLLDAERGRLWRWLLTLYKRGLERRITA